MLVPYWALWDNGIRNVRLSHDTAYIAIMDMHLAGHIARDAASGAVLRHVEGMYELLIPIPHLPPGMQRWDVRRVGNRKMSEREAVDAANRVLPAAVKRADRGALDYLPEARQALIATLRGVALLRVLEAGLRALT